MKKMLVVCGIACFATLASAVHGVGTEVSPTGHEWEQEQNLSYNKERARAWAFSFKSEANAKKILPENSVRWCSLDSTTAWKFMWSKDPSSRPANFYQPTFDVSGWETIVVPCSWQTLGAKPGNKGRWGTALYCNQPYPFAQDWPRVMTTPPKHYTNYKERNPVGSYRRDFTVPETWTGEEVYIQFDGVDSFFYLWINGRYVGFSKNSRDPATFRITPYLKAGTNVLAAEVYRHSDAAYLECQDMTRLSGIFRTVQLFATPKLHIRDFFALTEPMDWNKMKGGTWEVTVDVELENLHDRNVLAAGRLSARLIDAQTGAVVTPLKPVDIPYDGIATKSIDITGQRSYKTGLKLRFDAPKLWSAEEPNLYTLLLELRDSEGALLEIIPSQLGFRKVEVAARKGDAKARFWVNGEKIKLKGVNRHEADPMTGHTVSRERQEQDVRLMKEGNINHVRNSHYPTDPYFYYLCNLYGIYVEDEANIESHGYYYGKESLSHPVEWLDAHVDRIMAMVERNKNQPCVVLWSLGNEAGPGRNFLIAERTLKARDRSRPSHYERNNDIVDIGSNQYPSVGWVQWKATDKNADKPFYISEYAHNMMNALGDFIDYQDAIEASDVIMGGAIWDWVDQALWTDMPNGTRVLAYGGDWGDHPNSGQFVCNGTILADRTPEPGYYEVAHVFQNIKAQLSDGKIEIQNKNYFRSLDYVEAQWTLLKNGKPTSETGSFDVATLAPQQRKTFAMPVRIPRDTNGYALQIKFVLRANAGLLKKGFAVAADQIELQPAAPQRIAIEGRVKMTENADTYCFTGATGVKVTFSKKAATLAQITMDGKALLRQPMQVDAFRCPSSNEVGQGGAWAQQGLRTLVPVKAEITPPVIGQDGVASFTTTATVMGKVLERLCDFDNGFTSKTYFETLKQPVDTLNTHFVVNAQWRVYPDGTVTMQSALLPRGRVIELPRVGYNLVLDGTLNTVDYFARGPFENYPDRKSGAFAAVYTDTVKNMVVNYARPNDMGNREEAQCVRVGNDAVGLSVVALNDSAFAFSAIPYTATELCQTRHPQELPASDKTVLTLLAVNRGLGGASCGPGPLDRDIPRANKPYRLNLAFRPVRESGVLPRVQEKVLAVDETMPPPPETFTVVECTSQEPGNEGQLACDGDATTIWHSQYGVTLGKYPHGLTLDLNKPRTLKGITCMSRQEGGNGMIKAYQVEVSADRKTWVKVAEGELRGVSEKQYVLFAKPAQNVRYVRFTGLSEQRGQEFASMAELGILE
ncbi:MAG: glycoside hydrolase family 2 TIM barrel-domain containing protein [Kiritimatiellia bacterium]